jgi:hypothetical protein
VDVLVGGSGIETFVLGSSQGAATKVKGGAGTNTLVGANVANTWNITGANAGKINGIAFSGIQNLKGNAGIDTFKFANGGSVTGLISGGGASDKLDYSAVASPITVNLQTSTATLTGGIAGIASLVGGSGNNTLVGSDTSNTWLINSTNSGTLNNTFSFSGIGNLTGGAGNDTFKFAANNVGVTGVVSGGGGTDALNYTAWTSSITVNLQTLTATRTGGIAAISTVAAGSGTNTLVGPNGVNTWNLTGPNAGTINGIFAFTGVGNLTGGTSSDIFKFGPNASITGKVTGGGGAETLDYSGNAGVAVTINLQAGTATSTAGISNVTGLVGSAAVTNTLVAANTTNSWSITGPNAGSLNSAFTFSNIQNLTGGKANDSFQFTDAGSIAGKVNGGGGVDTLEAALTS